jgi:hypothetical protein
VSYIISQLGPVNYCGVECFAAANIGSLNTLLLVPAAILVAVLCLLAIGLAKRRIVNREKLTAAHPGDHLVRERLSLTTTILKQQGTSKAQTLCPDEYGINQIELPAPPEFPVPFRLGPIQRPLVTAGAE